jgi:hypothetical protein
MRTISSEIGSGPIDVSYIIGTTCEVRTPLERKRRDRTESLVERFPANDNPRPVLHRVTKVGQRQSLGFCGFISNPFPRSSQVKLGYKLLLGDRPDQPVAANDNDHAERWPVWEEYKAGRLPPAAWDAANYISTVWNSFRTEVEPYLTPGTFRYTGEARTPTVGDLSELRGAERYAHITSLWQRLDRRTEGRFSLVKRALVDRCEMKDLASDVSKTRRAAIGRERLIAALPIVADELRLLDVAEAA